MYVFIKRLPLLIFAIYFCLSLSLQAMEAELDLHGDGQLTKVNLPFKYYERQDGDRLSLIHQGGYRVYEIDKCKQDVVILGPLRPCIGVAVTDGKKLVVFHKHCTNSLVSLERVLREHLNLDNQQNLFARIFTTRDDKEWIESHRQLFNGGKSHTDEVKRVKDFLNTTIGIARLQIPANLYNLRNSDGSLIYFDNYPDSYLGRYDRALECVAIRLNDLLESSEGKTQIKFSSIDPFTEDVFGFKGTEIKNADFLGDVVQSQDEEAFFKAKYSKYDLIPVQYGTKIGYQLQRSICMKKLFHEEETHYLRFFKKSHDEVMNCGVSGYDTLDFYPLP